MNGLCSDLNLTTFGVGGELLLSRRECGIDVRQEITELFPEKYVTFGRIIERGSPSGCYLKRGSLRGADIHLNFNLDKTNARSPNVQQVCLSKKTF